MLEVSEFYEKALAQSNDPLARRSSSSLRSGSLRSKPSQKEEILALFDEIDVDENKQIEYSEWLCAHVDRTHLLSDENLKLAFGFLDRDGSQKLETDEIRKIFSAAGEVGSYLWEEIIDSTDFDHDGKMSYSEFVHIMRNYDKHEVKINIVKREKFLHAQEEEQ
jgi:Ca2+-binding EF-hand superfamily protein